MKKRLISTLILLSIMFFVFTPLASCGCNGTVGERDDIDKIFDEDEIPDESETPDGDEDPNAEKYTVTLKNADGTVLAEHSVPSGTVINEPDMPQVEGFFFLGWYEDEAEAPFDFKSPITENTVLCARWQGRVVSEDVISPTVVDSDYSVADLSVDTLNSTVTLKLIIKDNCFVKILFAKEDTFFRGDFFASGEYIEDVFAEGKAIAIEDEEYTELVLTLEGELPENFVTVALLLDEEGEDLCAPYTSVKNTKAYQSFSEKTVADFSSDENVLTFTERTDSNFGVLADGVKILSASEIVEIPMNSDGDVVYRFIGLSDTVAEGDRIYVKAANGTEALIKVDKATPSDAALTVIPSRADGENGYLLTDFYKFIKVDMKCYGVINPTANNASPLSAIENPTDSFKNSFDVKREPYKFERDGLKFTANIDGVVTVECSYLYDPALFGEEYFECALVMDTDFKFTVNLAYENSSDSDETDSQDRRGTTLIVVPTPIFAGFSPKLELGMVYEWEISASATAGIRVQKQLGFKFDPNNKFTKIVGKTDVEPIVDFYGKARLEIGPTVCLGVDFLRGVVSAEIELVRTAILTATLGDNPDMIEAGAVHNCYLCVSGTVDAAWEVNANLKTRIGRNLEWTLYKKEILKNKETLYAKTVSKESKDGPFIITNSECKNYTAEFGIWRFDNCICVRFGQEISEHPENLISYTHTPAWEITVRTLDGEVIATASGVGSSFPEKTVVLKYGELYSIELKETCNRTQEWYDSNGDKQIKNYPPLIKVTNYLGEWRVAEISEKLYYIFYDSADGENKSLAKYLRSTQIED